MQEALFYKKTDTSTIQCQLCPHFCQLAEGQTGQCRVRKNIGNTLITTNYGKLTVMNFNPIEKKPIYHLSPGKQVLSVGLFGCNLHCKFCQNSSIAQISASEASDTKNYKPEDIIKIAKSRTANIGIAYTYNEPSIYYEFMYDTAKLATANRLSNIVVSNGYINHKPLEKLLPYIDAFNIDLKSFDDIFYKQLTSSTLAPVLNTLQQIAEANKLLEITTLIIPTKNDNQEIFTEMVAWISEKLGRNTPLHLSRYFPMYKLKINSTPLKTLSKLYQIAKKHLNYVYVGNVDDTSAQNTYCPNCSHVVIERNAYNIKITGIDSDMNCDFCGHSLTIF